MESERDRYEKNSEKVLGVETRPDQANVGDELVRGKPLPVDGESLAEGKPSLGAAKGKVDEISGAETFRDRSEVVGEDSMERKPSLDESGLTLKNQFRP